MEEGSGINQLDFMMAAAHELKSPLALIRQLSLSLEQQDISPAESSRIARQITLTSERSLRLTSDLTRTTRLEDSLFSFETINAKQLFEEVAHELTPLYKARGRDIQVKAGRRQLLALANRDLLRSILVNFSDNALHYADSQNPVVLKASPTMGGERIVFGVRDHGPSIPSDIWRRVERHLGNAPMPLQSRPASSGLGLYIASQFAEAMQGSIGATRHRDGVTFHVTLLASKQLRLL